MPMARPTIAASASGVLKQRSRAELDLQAVRRLEDAALAFHLRRVRFAAAIGHVFAEHEHIADCAASPRAAWR